MPIYNNIVIYAYMEKHANHSDLRAAAGRAAEFLRLLANENRLAILCALGEGELSVGALAAELGTSQPNVSQHLAKMRLGGMVATRQEGTKVFYRLQNEHARQLVMDAIHQAEHALGTAPRHGA